MSFNLGKLFIEWRRIVPNGVPNPSNDYHLVLLKEVCLANGIDVDTTNNVILALEKKDDEKIKWKDTDGKDRETGLDTIKQYASDIKSGDSSQNKKLAVAAADLKDKESDGEDDESEKKTMTIDKNPYETDDSGKGDKTKEESENIVTSFANEKDDILKGKKSPPGTGGSAIGEMYGGVALEEYNDKPISEDDFVNKHFDDVRNSSVSKGMKDSDIKVWLKVSYKTGVSEIEELQNNKKYRFKKPQSNPYPIGVMDPVNDKGGSKKRLLGLMDTKLQEATSANDDDAVKHYKRQIKFITEREDSDTGVLYETTDGFIGFKHTSNKKSFTDPVFNTTVNKRGEVMKSAVDSVSKEYNINQEDAKRIESNIDTNIQTAVTSIEEAGQGPSGAIQNNVSNSREFSSKHKLGKQLQNLGAGSKGRSGLFNWY